MVHSILFAFLLVAITKPSFALDLVFQELSKTILTQSPLGKYQQGIRISGVFNVHDARYCDPKIVDNVYSLQSPPVKATVLRDSTLVFDREILARRGIKIKTEAMASSIRKNTELLLNGLIKNGDALAKGRHICLGLAQFEKPNAHSMMIGYMIFDPQIIFNVNNNIRRSLYSADAIIAHEFAHQLQYWNQDETLKDILPNGQGYSRRKELQADCVAAALLTMSKSVEEIFKKQWEYDKQGIKASVGALGDFLLNESDHHGLINERELVAEYGIKIAGDYKLKHASNFGFTSTYALNVCRSFIDANNKAHGNVWPFTLKIQ